MKQRRQDHVVESLLATTVSSKDANFLVANSLEARGILLIILLRGLSKGSDQHIAYIGKFIAVDESWMLGEC